MSSGSRLLALALAILATSMFWRAAAVARRGVARQPRWPAPTHLIATPVQDAAGPPARPGVLRVCADPNNLPFSDREGQGFENRLAEMVARDLGRTLEYYWTPERRGFIRTALDAGRCDLVAGIPSRSDRVRVTHPYYRSSYVFVSRSDRRLRVSSLDDPRLRRLRVGIPITGEDYENPPPAQALADRRIIDNVRGYPVYGDYSRPHPSWNVLDAVLKGDVDVAIAWGPAAGFFARRTGGRVVLAPIRGRLDPRLPFDFDISMGVRRGDAVLGAAVDRALARHAAEIRQVLASYGVPL